MIERCKECGANLAMVGIRHRCIPGASPVLANAVSRPSRGLRIKSRKSDATVGDGVSLTSIVHPPGLIEKMADAIKSGKLSLKRGRPRIGEKRDQPWKAAGMSKTTWYRRKAEEKAK